MEIYLQWKSYMAYQMAATVMTLNELKGYLLGCMLFQMHYVRSRIQDLQTGGQGRAPQARVSRRQRRRGCGAWRRGFPWSLLQTATLVFPRPIVCSRFGNNINILAKKIAMPPTGGACPRPRAGSATDYVEHLCNILHECNWHCARGPSTLAELPVWIGRLQTRE